MENQAIESFINFCDEMQIANEGFKLKLKSPKEIMQTIRVFFKK